jgi:hypothetical protein
VQKESWIYMKNDYEILGEVTVIFLRRRNGDVLKTFIDTDDLSMVQEYPNSWYAYCCKKGNTFYADGHLPMVGGKRKKISLHRWIMNPSRGLVVDHINHNTLDNRKSNLRVITQGQNNQNRKKIRVESKSGIRGVYWDKKNNKWRSHIQIDRKQIYLGYFTDLSEAELAVKNARVKYMPYSQEALNGGDSA